MAIDSFDTLPKLLKHNYEALGVSSMFTSIVYHTMGTNLTYRPDEKEALFIRDREKMGEKEAFHKLHNMMEEALNQTKYFRSYG